MNRAKRFAAELGLTVRCAVLMVLALAAFIVAGTAGGRAFYGVALALAFIAGAMWDRQILCGDCGKSQEER